MRTILAVCDLEGDGDGLKTAAALAARTGAALHAMHAFRLVGLSLREAIPHLERGALERMQQRLAARVAGECAELGVAAAGCHVDFLDPSEAIPLRALELGADLVVVGRKMAREAAGGVRALTTAPCPILVVPVGRPWPLRRVLVPLAEHDLQGGTLRDACTWVNRLAEAADGAARTELHVLHVAEELRRWRECAPALFDAVRDAEPHVPGAGRIHGEVRWGGAPAEWILKTAREEGTDLVVLRAPRRGIGKPSERRTRESVAAAAPCPVLVLTSPVGEEQRGTGDSANEEEDDLLAVAGVAIA